MGRRYPGGIIRATPASPTAGAAPGIWTLEEAMQAQAEGNWPGVTSLLELSSGFSYIGDMTGGDGLAALFDQNITSTNAISASPTTNGSYGGIDAGAGNQILPTQIEVHPNSNGVSGFAGGNLTELSIAIRGNDSAPASRTDGVALGTTGIIADTTEIVTFTNLGDTPYRFLWIDFDFAAGGADNFVASQMYISGALV